MQIVLLQTITEIQNLNFTLLLLLREDQQMNLEQKQIVLQYMLKILVILDFMSQKSREERNLAERNTVAKVFQLSLTLILEKVNFYIIMFMNLVEDIVTLK